MGLLSDFTAAILSQHQSSTTGAVVSSMPVPLLAAVTGNTTTKRSAPANGSWSPGSSMPAIQNTVAMLQLRCTIDPQFTSYRT